MRPGRIIDDEENGFEAQLLRTALGEEPPHGAIGRAETALGVGAGLGLAAAVTATAKTASAHLASVQGATQVGALSLAKWVGIGMVGGLVVTGGARYATDPAVREMVSLRSTATDDAPARVKSRRAPSRRAVPVATSAPAAEPAPESIPAASAIPDPVPSAIPDPPAPPPPIVQYDALRPAANAPSRIASLAGELSVVQRARQALLDGRPDVVLRELAAFQRTGGAGVLLPEAEMLTIEALLQQGNTAEAQRRAQRSLAHAPDGPHAARLRQIAASTQ